MDLAGIAERQLRDYDAHRPGRSFDDPSLTLTVEQAYTLQAAVAKRREERGEAITGYKLGCVSSAIQTQFGLRKPVVGHLFASELHPSGCRLDTQVFESPAIEGELALRVGQDIESSAWLREHVSEAVESVFLVIELHNHVFRREPPSAPELIANNALNAGVVMPASESLDIDVHSLGSTPLTVVRNGDALGASTGGEVPGGPIGSLMAVVDRVAAQGKIVRRGQIILTGSPLPLYGVCAGDAIQVHSEGFAPVSASFT